MIDVMQLLLVVAVLLPIAVVLFFRSLSTPPHALKGISRPPHRTSWFKYVIHGDFSHYQRPWELLQEFRAAQSKLLLIHTGLSGYLRGAPWILALCDPAGVHQVLRCTRKGRSLGFTQLPDELNLISSDGDQWKLRKRLAQPSFTPTGVRKMWSTMHKEVTNAIALLDANCGHVLDVDKVMSALALDIIGSCAFSSPFRALSGNNLWAAEAVGENFKDAQSMLLNPFLYHFYVSRIKTRLNRLRQYAKGLLSSRERSSTDLIDALMTPDKSGRKLSFDEVIVELSQFTASGHETTGRTLAFVLHELANRATDDFLAQLRAQVDAVMEGPVATTSELSKMPLIKAVLREASRLWNPTAVGPFREIESPTVLCGYEIPEGTVINCPIWSLHRHPEHWEEPDEFDPSRFLDADGSLTQLSKFKAYNPFGQPPRSCIGNELAKQEMAMMLSSILKRYTFAPASGVKSDHIETVLHFTLKPKNGVPLIFQRR